MKTIFSVAVAAVCMLCTSALFADITLNDVNFRTFGPVNPDVTGATPLSHGGMPLVVSLTASNQDVDGDSVIDADFTFDVVFSSMTTGGGVSLWGQGVSNSNAAGTGNTFSNIEGIMIEVQNVSGVTSSGETVEFAGFSNFGLGTFDFSGNEGANQAALVNGNLLEANFAGMGTGGTAEFAGGLPGGLATTLSVQNAAVTSGTQAGSRIIRTLDLQFTSVSAIPEPSSVIVLGLAGVALGLRRRK